MAVFSEPTKWAQALGATANADVIPDEAGAMDVDISKIFPAVFSVPLSHGGKAIPRRTLNGIFKTLGDWAFYNQNGGVPSYNADFDYTIGRFVSYNGSLYKCIQDNVHTAPHNPTDKNYWAELSDSSSIQVVIDNIATALNGKADRSLSNVDNTGNVLMAHNAMPSNKHVELTLGASGTSYAAPADGYFLGVGTATAPNSQIVLTQPGGVKSSWTAGSNGAAYAAIFIPVSKGNAIEFTYSLMAVPLLYFIYANGSESAQ